MRPDWLVYATGALAFARVDYGYSVSEPDTGSTGFVSASDTSPGGPRRGSGDSNEPATSLEGKYLFYDFSVGASDLLQLLLEEFAVGDESSHAGFKTQGNDHGWPELRLVTSPLPSRLNRADLCLRSCIRPKPTNSTYTP